MGEKGVWCGICVKYLAFGTYLTSTVGALLLFIQFVTALFLFHLNCLALQYEKQKLDSSSC